MILKQLTIKGFKSFADKTEISFNQGVTSIVGPNGCGKSNILDAIRWALGEQNPRHLRGLQMQNVIFSGTETRRSEGLAEVSLLLDNSSRVFPIEYAEVLVTRRLYRSGESEYMINKSPCRLRDILELFMDTGIGKSTYSIMEQGRVEQILNSRPMERRAIFEEAAGITKYKARRDEALRKLARTEQDLVRLTDILAELGRQVRSLKRQAGLADRYERYHAELQKHELSLIARKAQQLENDTIQVEKDRKTCEDQREAMAAERASLHATLTETEQRVSALDEQVHRLAEEQIRLRGEMERWDEKGQSARRRQAELEQRTVRLTEEQQEAEKRLETCRSSLAEKQSRAETEQQDVARNADEAAAMDRRFEQLDSLVRQQQSTVEQIRQSVLRLQNELTAGENDRQRIEREQELISAQDQKISSQQLQLAEEMKQIDSAIRDKQQQTEQTRTQLESLENACQTLAERLEQLSEEWEASSAGVNQLQTEIHAQKSRLASLCELQRSFDGYKDGVKHLLQERQRSDSSLSPQCQGPLADMLSVEKGYELAIEVALAHTLQLLVVDDTDEAVRLLQALSADGSGRAGFIPLDALSAFQRQSLPDLSDEDDLRRAVDVLRLPEGLQEVVQALFGDVVIAPTLQRAREVHRRLEGRIRVITPQGELIDTGGILSGGSHTEGGLLSRKREIEELETTLTQLQQQQVQSEQRREELKQLLQEHRRDREEQQSQRQQPQIALAKFDEELTSLAKQKDRLLKDQGVLSEEQLQRAQELAQLMEDAKTTNERVDRYRQEFHETSSRLEQEQELLEEKQEELRQVQQGRQQAAITLAEKRKDLERCRSEIHGMQEQISQLEQLVASRGEQRREIDQQRREAAEQIVEAGKKAGEILVEVEALEGRINEQRQQRRDVAEQRDLEQQKLEQTDDRRQELDDKVLALESAHVRVNLEKDNLARRLKHEYEKEYAEWATFDRQDDRPQEEIEAEADKLRNRMQRLGPVNRLAREEYDELNERFEFLTNQKSDLEKARANLLRTIADIKRTARDRFQKVFEEIRDHFRKTFRSIFGGGKADLLLLDEEDVIESGVEIVAQPPGKNLQSISLLSGGEKALTAISLLFAIYLIKPSPFCILDEIDAPLDDVNIGRFTTLLRQFTDRSQFLIITHNKRTMEMADIIYGITMAEQGVSRIMSMSFESAHRHAEPQADPSQTPEPEPNPPAEAPPQSPQETKSESPSSDPGDEPDVPRAKNGTPLEPYTVDEESVQFHEEDFVPNKDEVPEAQN